MTKFRAFFGAQDMTVGSPLKCLVNFSIPLLIGNLAQLLYGTVDSIVVGRVVGDTALAAVGCSGPIQNLFFVLFMTVAAGAGIMVSQYFGAKDGKNLSWTIGNSLTLIFIASVLLTAIGTPLSGALLRLTKATPEMFDMAKVYLQIIFIGVIGIAFYNILSGILRGMGEAVFPLLVLLGTCGLNIVLDIAFVAGLKMGVAGAAWATIISQILSAAVCLVKVLRLRGLVELKAEMLRPKKQIMLTLLKLGIPAGVTQGIISLSFVFVQSFINAMGTLVAACCTAVMRVDSFAMIPNQTFSVSASTYTGQNVGAGDMDRVNRGAKTVLLMSLIASAVLVTFVLTCGGLLLNMFTDTEEVIRMGIRMMRILGAGYIASAVSQSLSGVMRGAGDTMASMWITISTMVLVRIPLTWILARTSASEAWPHGNPDIIFVTLLVVFVLNMIVCVIYFKTGRWRTKAVVKRD